MSRLLSGQNSQPFLIYVYFSLYFLTIPLWIYHSKRLFTMKTRLWFYYALSICCSVTRPKSSINHFRFYGQRFITCIKSSVFVFLQQFLCFVTKSSKTQLSPVFNFESTRRNWTYQIIFRSFLTFELFATSWIRNFSRWILVNRETSRKCCSAAAQQQK